jgi:hypothetical protein
MFDGSDERGATGGRMFTGRAAGRPSAPGGRRPRRRARPYSDAGVFTQMYSVTSLLGLATRWGVELAK